MFIRLSHFISSLFNCSHSVVYHSVLPSVGCATLMHTYLFHTCLHCILPVLYQLKYAKPQVYIGAEPDGDDRELEESEEETVPSFAYIYTHWPLY